MRETCIMLALMLTLEKAHAAGLKDLIVGGEGPAMVSTAFSIFALGLMGYGGSAMLTIINAGRFARLFERSCYAMAFGLFFREAMKLFREFMTIVNG